MISNPQEIEQEAIAIANWIAYNNRPFVIPTSDGQKVILCLLTEAEFSKLKEPIIPENTAEAGDE